MLWWFLILGVSLVLVVSAAVSLYVQVRKQMKASAIKANADGPGRSAGNPELPPEV